MNEEDIKNFCNSDSLERIAYLNVHFKENIVKDNIVVDGTEIYKVAFLTTWK